MTLNDKDYNRLVSRIKQLQPGAIMSANIRELASSMKDAHIIDTNGTPPDLVTMNSRVLVQRLDNEQDLELSVVYHEDADTRTRKVSVFAPMGMALLGHREKETFSCCLPAGDVSFRIRRIMYQPESAGDHHL